jgi:hypothetical protein
MVVWNILRPFGVFYDHFGNLMVIWCVFLCFGTLYQEKSGNSAKKLSCNRFLVPKYKLALLVKKNKNKKLKQKNPNQTNKKTKQTTQ